MGTGGHHLEPPLSAIAQDPSPSHPTAPSSLVSVQLGPWVWHLLQSWALPCPQPQRGALPGLALGRAAGGTTSSFQGAVGWAWCGSLEGPAHRGLGSTHSGPNPPHPSLVCDGTSCLSMPKPPPHDSGVIWACHQAGWVTRTAQPSRPYLFLFSQFSTCETGAHGKVKQKREKQT